MNVESPSHQVANSLRVLVASPDTSVTDAAVAYLKLAGHMVVGVVDSTLDAVALARRSHPDLVLMDSPLKGLTNGVAAAKLIREELHRPVLHLLDRSVDGPLGLDTSMMTDGYTFKPVRQFELSMAIKQTMQRHHASEQLHSAQLSYASIVHGMDEGVLALDSAGVIRMMNPAAESMTGWTTSEAAGLPASHVLKILDETTQRTAELAVDEVIASGNIYRSSVSRLLVHRDGRHLPVDERIAPIRGYQGQIVGAAISIRDVSDLRRAEGAFSGLLAALPDAAILARRDGRIAQTNALTASMFGWEVQELIGQSVELLIPERMRAEHIDRRRLYAPDETPKRIGMTREAFGLRRDGSEFPIELGLNAFDTPRGMMTCVTIRDMSARHQARAALEASEQRWRMVVDGLPVMLLALDHRQRVVAWNQESARVTGWRAGELVGQDDALTLLLPDQSDRDSTLSAWMQTDARKNGVEWALRTRSGQTRQIRWFNVSSRLPIDGWSQWGIGFDETELRRLQLQVGHAQRIASIGQLAGGLAHDLNNILVAIQGYVELALLHPSQDQLPASASSQGYLRESLKACNRARDLVSRLLAYSRVGPGLTSTVVDVGVIAEEVASLVRASIPATKKLHVERQADLPGVNIDSGELHQVLMNLLLNARDATPEFGLINMTLAPVSMRRPRHCASCHLEFIGSGVSIEVCDNGPGVPQDSLTHIFDPFFSTKITGQGVGLGLSVVHGIVHGAGGHVEVLGQVGQGATFRVFLPAAVEEVSDSGKSLDVESAKPLRVIPLNGPRVLVVDDEPAVVDVASALLRKSGCVVTTAATAEEALALFRAQASDFDLVLTDQTLPEMSGIALAREILVLRHDIPVILWTGFSEAVDEESARRIGIRRFLFKPVSGATLLGAVADLVPLATSVSKG